jgi:hypothetical protein
MVLGSKNVSQEYIAPSAFASGYSATGTELKMFLDCGLQRCRCYGAIGRISVFEQLFGSEGTIENSPAFQCWDGSGNPESRRDG